MSLFFMLVGLGGCMPIPNVRSDLALPMPPPVVAFERVQSEYVDLPGYPEATTPERYNRALYLRFYSDVTPTDAVLILMPGIFGGATSLSVLAKQLVATHPGLEVWAIDRRANVLEDRRAMVASLEAGDPMIAYRYYVERAGQADGFTPRPPAELRFMARWGTEVHLRDLHVVVQQANRVADRVFLGGYSLGAALVSYYATFNFGNFGDSGTPDIGHTYLDGLVLIDGTLGRTGGYGQQDLGIALGPIQLVPNVVGLEAGQGSPYLTLMADPVHWARSEVSALLARFAPDELSPGGFVGYPATNRAVVGIKRANRYSPSAIFSATLGEAVGAELRGNLTAVLLDGAQGVYSQSVAGVAPGYDRVDWRRGDPARHHSDLERMVQNASTLEGNENEWYFPLRLLLDLMQLDVNLDNHPPYIPNAEVMTPTLAVGASRGLVQSLDGFAAYMNSRAGAPFSSYIAPDLTHADMLYADDNPVVPLLQRWLKRLPPRRP